MFPYSKERLEAARAEVSRYIRDVDDEDDALRIGKVRVADNDQDLGKTRKSGILWKDRPNLFCPTPLIDRPRTKDNHCSFHFSQVPVSKPSVPTVHGKPAPHLYKASYSTAVAHQKYIERDGAAEYSRAARQAAYIERDGAVEEALQSEPSEAVDERPEDVERVPLGPTMQGTELVPSVFSNISENQIEREEYWRAVERRARSPKTHYLALDPYASPRWWDNLDTVIILPPKLLRHLVEMREAKGAHDRGPQGRDGERYRAKDFPVSSDEAGAVLTSVLKSRYVDPANRPARFKPGRSGRIQYRLIAELPFELTPEERAQIVYEFTEFLGKKGLMYTAVIHAPNANNDTRNYHLHVIYHDRPAIFLEDRGCWDFEVSETYKDSSGKKRVRYPLKQPKVLAVAQSSSKSGDQDSGREFIPHLRKEYARITNLVLKAAGHLKRYDPRRYEEMGIKRTPTEHLGSRDAARESIGVPTRRGTRNAKIVWRDAEQAIDEQFEQTMKEHARRQEGYQKVLTAALASGVSDPSVDHLKSLLSGRAETIASIVSSRFGLMRFELLEAKAKSRAVKTRQTCEQMIKSVQEGAADKTTTTNLPLLIQRQELAKDHLENIDADLETFRTHLAVLAEAVCRYEENFLEVDELALRMVKRIQALSPTRMQSLAPVNGSGVGESNDPQATGAKQPVVPITIGGAPIVTPTIAPRIKPVPVTLEAVEEDQVPFAETIRAVRAGGGHVNTGTPANDRLEPPARSLSTPDIIGEPHAQGPDQAPPYVNHQISGRTQEINDAEHRRRRRYSVACSELIEGYNQQHAEAHPRRSSAGGLSSMRKLPRRNLVRDGSHPALPLPSSPLRNVESQSNRDHALQRPGEGDRHLGSERHLVAEASLPPQRIPGPAITVTQMPPQRLPGPPILWTQLPPQRRVAAASRQRLPQVSLVTKDGVGSFEDRRPDETKIDSDLPTVDRKVKEGQAQSRSPEQEYAVWTSLVDRIYEKRLNIVAAQDPDGGTWLTVSELSASELEVLHNPKFKNRCLKRLTKICDIQYRELKKVKSYIISLANEPGKLEILDGPVLFHDTSKAMHALFKQYLHYEDVRDLVSNIKLQRELASRQVELIRQRSIEDAGLAALAQKQALMNKPDGR